MGNCRSVSLTPSNDSEKQFPNYEEHKIPVTFYKYVNQDDQDYYLLIQMYRAVNDPEKSMAFASIQRKNQNDVTYRHRLLIKESPDQEEGYFCGFFIKWDGFSCDFKVKTTNSTTPIAPEIITESVNVESLVHHGEYEDIMKDPETPILIFVKKDI